MYTNSPSLFGTKLAQWILPGELRSPAMEFYDAQNFPWEFPKKHPNALHVKKSYSRQSRARAVVTIATSHYSGSQWLP